MYLLGKGDCWVDVRCARYGRDDGVRRVAVCRWGVDMIVCPVCGRRVLLPKERQRWVRESGEERDRT